VLTRFRRLPSPALVIASIALILAVGGGSFALAITDKKSDKKIAKKVANKQIKRKAPSLSVNHANTADNASQLGGVGPGGYAGATDWALVRVDGSVDSQSGGITVSHSPGAGSYYVDFGHSVTNRPIIVTLNYGNFAGTIYVGGQVTAAPCGGAASDLVRTNCTVAGTNDSNHVFVKTTNPTGAGADRPFYVAVLN
jgi:hypothetical protein